MSDVTNEQQQYVPNHLVSILAEEAYFQATLIKLLEDNELEPSKIKNLVTTYSRVFELDGETVKLHPKVSVCRAYRWSGNCRRGRNCKTLHICTRYIAGDCEDEDECSFNHDWQAEPNGRILYEKFLEELPSSTLCKLVHDADKGIQPSSPIKPTGEATVSATGLNGNVHIPEICFESVVGICRYEENGCPRLHAKRHYHWQVKDSEEDPWSNLPELQVNELEQAYCQISDESVSLTRLKANRDGPIQIMGRDLWEADFNTFTLQNSDEKKIQIRRLCTEVIADERILENNHLWYIYLNEQWERFGRTDDPMINALSSETLEQSYINKDVNVTRFRAGNNSCIINFKKMEYIDVTSGDTYPLRRRPYPHISNKEQFDFLPLPDAWREMSPGESFITENLKPTTPEYKEILGILTKDGISRKRVSIIKRIQNPVLWRKFQKRVLEMLSTQFHTKYLFHPAKNDTVFSVYRDNFDRNIQDSEVTNKYGQGNYFFSNGKRALAFSQPDENNDRYVFVAQVAVGCVTKGCASMTEAPINPMTNAPFNSTVDDVADPKMYVKFNKDEYYPAYIAKVT